MSDQFNAKTALVSWMDRIADAPQILVGYSGGLDSTVLLKFLSQVVDPARLCAVHINHGLSPHANRWQEMAAQFCTQIGVDFHAEKVQVNPRGQGWEAEARAQRLAVFERLLISQGLLFLGHHGDDQAETVLYRLLRGSGPKGLSAMSACRPLGAGQLIRPLLGWSKAQLAACGHQLNLQWVEDESNADNRFDRNFLRNRVIPQIAERWPDFQQSLQSSAQLCNESEQLAEALAIEDMAGLDLRAERAGHSIATDKFIALPVIRQRNVLRHWPQFNGMPMPAGKIIDEVLTSVLRAREDREPQVIWQSLRWSKYRDRLYLLNVESLNIDRQLLVWDLKQSLRLADSSLLSVVETTGAGLRADIGAVEIRYRQGGERCKPSGRSRSNTLKKLLQEHGLEPWWRDRVPLLYIDNILVAVGDLWICEGWCASAGQPGYIINWQVPLR